MKPEITRCMFLSSNCRRFSHDECPGAWNGLGIEIFCECGCHKGTRETLSEETVRIGTNAIRWSTKDGSIYDGKEPSVLSLGKRFGRPSPRTEVMQPGGNLIRPCR